MIRNYRWLRLLLLVPIVIVLFQMQNNKTPTFFEKVLSTRSSHTKSMSLEKSTLIVNFNKKFSSSSVLINGTNVPRHRMFVISKVTNSKQQHRKSTPFNSVSSKTPELTETLTRRGRFDMSTYSTTQMVTSFKSTTPVPVSTQMKLNSASRIFSQSVSALQSLRRSSSSWTTLWPR